MFLGLWLLDFSLCLHLHVAFSLSFLLPLLRTVVTRFRADPGDSRWSSSPEP